jgi:thiamine kinase-like enzyme
MTAFVYTCLLFFTIGFNTFTQALTEDAYLGYITEQFLHPYLNKKSNSDPVVIPTDVEDFLFNTLKSASLIKDKNELITIEPNFIGQANDVWIVTTPDKKLSVRKIRPPKFRVFNVARAEFLKQQNKHISFLPTLHYYDPSNGVTVYDYVEGNIIGLDKLTPEKLRKIGAMLKQLHQTPMDNYPMETLFNPMEIIEQKNKHYGINKERFNPRIAVVHDKIKTIFNAMTPKVTLCHNDILWSDIIYPEGEGTPKLIDLDSFGLGFPYWDLGSLISWSDLDDEETGYLLEGYGLKGNAQALEEIMVFKDIADLFEYYVNLKHEKVFNQLMLVKYGHRLLRKYDNTKSL